MNAFVNRLIFIKTLYRWDTVYIIKPNKKESTDKLTIGHANWVRKKNF